MGQYLLALVAALVVGAVIFGIAVLVTGSDSGLGRVEPDSRATPLPGTRPLAERDIDDVRFDTAWRGYRMAQVDAALRRAAYDIGYKDELIGVLEAEVAALREGRMSDAEVLRRAREAALAPAGSLPTDGYAGQPPAAIDAPDGAEATSDADPDASADLSDSGDEESPPDAAPASPVADEPAPDTSARAVDAAASPPERA
ncbi:MAG TPA: DivIVA domain-containing protein [Micromonosporaceae bacterium]|jgi:DivIVA domain-containing protein